MFLLPVKKKKNVRSGIPIYVYIVVRAKTGGRKRTRRCAIGPLRARGLIDSGISKYLGGLPIW